MESALGVFEGQAKFDGECHPVFTRVASLDGVLYHDLGNPDWEAVEVTGRGPWFSMVMTLKTYAESHGYRLAAVFGFTPYDTHYYYVRPDFPHSSEIIGKIRNMDYFWPGSDRKAVDYARLAPCAGHPNTWTGS